MAELIEVLKDADGEHPVPTAWRNTIFRIVEALRQNEYNLHSVRGVSAVTSNEADRLRRNIAAYGAHLSELPESAWNTSICRWMEYYWEFLVDLFTEEEGESDLVLYIKFYEWGGSYRFNVESVHVP